MNAKRGASPTTATKKAAAKKAAKKTTAKKAAKKTTAKKAASKKAASATKTAAAKKTAARMTAKKAPASKKAAKKTTAKKAPAKKTAAKKAPAKKTSAKKAAKKTPAKKAATPVVVRPLAERAAWLVGPLAPLRALAEEVVDLGVDVVDEEDSRVGGDTLRERYAENWSLGILWSDELWAACQERVAGLRLWATGPAMRNALGLEVRPSLFVDPTEPGRLWYTPSDELPAALFVPLMATREAVALALDELGPNTKPVEPGEARSVRAYMGAAAFLRVPSPYSGQLEPAGPHEMDRHFNFSPVVTPHSWGSAYADDPLLGRERLSTVGEVVALREMRAQTEGGLPRFTRRAYFSRAHVAIEMHARGHYVWDIGYRPARLSAGVIASFNALTHNGYPADLPVDVAAAVHGFMFLDAAMLDAEIAAETEPGRRSALVSAALAVAADDITEAARIARAAITRELPDQVAVANAATQYNWQFLLEELGATTTDAGLRGFVEQVIVQGLAPPPLNEHGEPADLYDSVDDGDDEEAEEEDDDA